MQRECIICEISCFSHIEGQSGLTFERVKDVSLKDVSLFAGFCGVVGIISLFSSLMIGNILSTVVSIVALLFLI